MSMPAIRHFMRLDVRPLLQRGEEPLPAILGRVESLAAGRGLLVIAPFLPSPLIELLKSRGFSSKFEPGDPGSWIVYFWREED